MRYKFTLLLTALLCMAGLNAWAIDQKDGVYQIGSSQDLAAFAEVVNTQNRFASAVLTADIDYTQGFVQIAKATGNTYRQAFAGTFDGQGHKITVDIPAGENEGDAALFCSNSGIIKNLVVDGKIAVAKKYAGAIAAYNNGTVRNCVSLVDFTSVLTGDNTAGGVVGAGYYSSIVDHCVFAGTVTGTGATNWGGISGWLNQMNVTNCLNIAAFDINIAEGNSRPIIRTSDTGDIPGRIRNNLYADTWAGSYTNVGSTAITADQITSGYAAYVLGMGQKIGEDKYPSPTSTDRVYAKGSCDPALAAGFTNNAAEAAAHTWNGYVCSTCGQLNTEFVKADADGFYPIGSAQELKWFGDMIMKGYVDIKGKLTADIDLGGEDIVLCNDSGMFAGTFDGQFHKVSNLKINRPGNTPYGKNVGLFGSIGGQSKLQNVVIDETCSVLGYQHVGGLIGHGGQAGSWNEVEGIISYATVAAQELNDGGASDAGVGGIVGNYNDVCFGKMTNCAFLGKVSGTSSGMLSGWFGNTQSAGCPPGLDHTFQYTVTGCWSVAEKPAETALNQCFGRASSSGTCVKFINCATMYGEQAPNFTQEDVASGALAWIINGESGENPAWFQKLGTDKQPTLQGTDVVYKVGVKNCDGSDGEGFGFSNVNTGFTQIPHNVDPNTGLCTVCGQWIPAEDGWYEITSVETFLRFAELAKTDASIKGRMTTDLDFTGVDDSWAPIGGTKNFVGQFDGQGHKFSNLVLNHPEKSDYGLFKTGANVVLKNFYLDPTCSIIGAQKVGIIGNHNGGGALFENIGNMGTVNGEGENVAGLFGGAWSGGTPVTINSCWVVGEIITGEREGAKNPGNCASFAGWTNSGTFIFNDCWSIAKVKNASAGTYFTRKNGSITVELNNCYCLFGTQVNPIPGYENAPSAEDAEKDELRAKALADLGTGSMTYMLNGDQSTIKWYQTLGKDETPVPWSDHKQVYVDGKVLCNGHPVGNVTFTNEPTGNVPTHSFEHGFCTSCGTIDINYKQPVNDFYELADGLDVVWFAALAELGNPNVNARLTADIDMTDVNEKYKPFGTKYIYGGTFDGDYHTVSNLIIDMPDVNNVGFISQVKTGATLKNIIFDSSCSITGGTYVGLIGGSPSGETGEIYMTNVGYEGNITATAGENAGAIIGCNHGSAALYQLTGCYSTGIISGVKENGALSGWVGSSGGKITNCWSTATVENAQSDERYLYRHGSTAPTASRVYATVGAQGTIVTEEQMKNGDVTFALNGSSFLDATWFQTIGEDEHPTFVPGHGVVYKVGEEIGDVHDDGSYHTLLTLMISAETEMAEEAVACQALLDEYLTTVESWTDVPTFDEFCISYRESQTQRDAISNSMKAYKTYIDACEYAIKYLSENSFTSDMRTFLEGYLNGDGAPSDDYPNGTYGHVVKVHELDDEGIAAETDFVNSLLQRTIATNIIPGTEITVTLANYDFKDKLNGWTVETTNGGVTTGGETSIMTVARGLNTNFSMEQTLEGLPNGVYVMSANAFERTAGDDYSQYHVGQLYLNDNANFVMTIGEDVIDVNDAEDGVNCHITGSSTDREYVYEDINGYVPGYMIGASYAFNGGRYMNYTAVEVTDSTLTVGARNLGSGLSNDWLVVGNIRLFYLGTAEQASDMLTTVLEGYVARATVIRDFAWVDTEEAPKYPNMSEALKAELADLIDASATATTGEEKMDLVNKFSALFNSIYDCRKAYVEMATTADEVSNAAGLLKDKNLIDQAQLDEVTAVYDKAWISYQDGNVTAEEARAITAELRAFSFSPEKDENGVYQLATARDLGIFALIVNGGENDANAVLTADIDMEGIEFTPIGWNMTTDNSSANTISSSPNTLYKGHFDGQGHRIKNLVVNYPGSIGVGLFGDITYPAHIENFVLDETCEIHGSDRAGVIGRAEASGKSGAERVITINNVGNEGKVYANTAPAGILGNANNSSLAIITNCYSTGLITMETESTIGTSDHNAALICGWLANLGAEITNCWSTAEITNYQTVDRAFCRVGGDNNKFVNNYSTFATQTYVVPAEAFTTGEVTYKLNGGVTNNTAVWYQNIGEDAHPTFDASHQIVFLKDDGTYYNDGTTAIRTIATTLGNKVSVFDAQGRMVRSNVSASEAVKGMTSGMYILKGEGKSIKVLVK